MRDYQVHFSVRRNDVLDGFIHTRLYDHKSIEDVRLVIARISILVKT